MSRRIFQFVGALVLVLAAFTPLMECFDRWDKNPGPGSDTEIHLTAWFVGVGIVLTLAKLLRYVPMLRRSEARRGHWVQPSSVVWLSETDRPAPTGSPPLTPLRI